MAKIFHWDNPVWMFLGKLTDMVFLTVLWMACCIPLVTAGASTAALYDVSLKLAQDQEGYIFASFFRSFRKNWKKSTAAWLGAALVGVFLLADLYVYAQIERQAGIVLLAAAGVMSIIYLMTLVHYGWMFYQKKFQIPKMLLSERIVLRFGSVTQHARVYLNGQLLCEHKGGFLPFEIELHTPSEIRTHSERDRDQEVICEGDNLLCVAVDNRIDFSTLPVGNESSQAMFGSELPDFESVRKTKPAPQNYPNFDFFNYAGIHRPVKLYTTPAEYIREITLVPSVNGDQAEVKYEIQCGGSRQCTGTENGQSENAENCGDSAGSIEPRITILDENGVIAASGTGAKGSVILEQVRLWQPGKAYLYTARVEYGQDLYEETFGVRTVEVANEPDTAARAQSAYEYFRPLYELAHCCDPQDRPVTVVVCNNNYP